MELTNNTSEENSRTEEPISLEKIAFLTDFPEDFIKKELLLDGITEITMSEFRKKVLDYLDRSMDLVG
jgi:hypothetical protein